MAVIFREFMPVARTNGDTEWYLQCSRKFYYDTGNARVTSPNMRMLFEIARFFLKRLKHVAINLRGNARATCRDNTLKEER